jgi:hypothetical protein
MTEFIDGFKKKLWKKLNSKGAEKVRQEIRFGAYTGIDKRFVDEWLRSHEKTKKSGRESRKESREKEANLIAQSARATAIWACTAVIIASIRAIGSICMPFTKIKFR